ncbi:diguanylate cyclase [Paractinoplanes rishiriensis]|uniref:Serine/threonine protein kinase n=1 Tax=Paractinoplanes rishiriensis TaxID=1050105 RepID=A0A919N1U0_9ACTN|nr:diguanylate cyclase [Actinoplanes rishiriensis]GIF02336.1 serine/threonine protein kinase [Actinoplanes rishiriensis]
MELALDTRTEESLYQSSRTRVVRQWTDGRSVVLKETRGPGAVHRLHHEHAILTRLAGAPGVQQLAVPEPRDGVLVLTDSGASPLAALPAGDLDAAGLVDLAHALGSILATLHRRGVVHRDVNPNNVLLRPDRRPVLIDFDLATVSAQERMGFTATGVISGTLEYIAPEQTGRTGWPVDHRVDLYSLGATLYELATGAPPFGRGGDALRLVRCHLAERPQPAAEVNPHIPAMLSAITGRLLEKDPDKRYQSAEGLVHDLERLRAGSGEAFELGTRDFPIRLASAAQPVGRDAEIAALTSAFDATEAGPGRAVLVTGPPGVGKTSVIDQLRMAVTARGGWFVSGKFDEHRRDRAADGVWRAMRALGRLLLAEPEAELAGCRERLRERLGPNAGLIAAAVPEFATLLGEPPADTGGFDVTDLEVRLIRAAAEVLATVAAPDRPLVLFVDDLQWAGATAVGVLDAVITARPAGVLLVGAYRDAEVDAMHPLTGRLARWQGDDLLLPALRLANLPVGDVQTLLAAMLRLSPEDARTLAEAVGDRAKGNPFDTIELVNALRRDGALVPTDTGWEWDAAKIRSYVGATDVIELLTARIADLPGPSRELIEVAACLGDRIDAALLCTATGWSPAEIEDRGAPVLGDGLLVLETGHDGPAVAFRHDRVREAALVSAASGRADRHLTLARRFAGHADLWSLTAEQYLAANAEITEPAERRRAAGLFHTAAEAARLTDPAVAERYLAAAGHLLAGLDDTAAVRFAVRADHHAVLCGLSRFDDADRVYAEILADGPTTLELATLARARIIGLRTRNRQPEALAHGLDLLARLGARVPTEETLPAAIDAGLAAMSAWVSTGGPEDDLCRPEITEPALRAAARVIDHILPVAYFSGNPIFAWLVAEAQRMWAEHGPCAELVAPLSHAGFMTVMVRQDYRTGYLATRRALAVSEERAWEPQTSHARFLFSLGQGPWQEPVPRQLTIARQAREGLLRHGDLVAVHAFFSSLPLFLDCAPTLAAFSGDAEAASAAAQRAGDAVAGPAYLAFRQLARALRGDTAAPGDLSDDSVDIPALLAGQAENPTAVAYLHMNQALAALICHDAPTLIEHSAAAVPLLPFINATYLTSYVFLVRAFGLIEQVRAAEPDQRAEPRAALDEVHAWWIARAADAPENFRHLVHLINAEVHWLDGEPWPAAAEFDAAMTAVAQQTRPWHTALIAERAGRFYVATGISHVGWSLLAQARDRYNEWGAAGKVAQLTQAYPRLAVAFPGPGTGGSGTSSVSIASSTLDLMAAFDAARAISSATSLDSLQERLIDVLGAMTGATRIRLLLWDDTAREWDLLHNDPAAAGQVPLSVIRYVQRTESSLLIADAAQDDRFARDPYLAGMEGYSMLVAPVRSRGTLQALLLLEKPGERGAFTAEGMDAVTLVAGQLAVSIDNAQVYSSLERKVNQRTEALAAANLRLEELNRTDALTGLANRRRLEEALAAEWAHAQATGTSVGVIMVDIDHFKQYNDHYGHLGGDHCLRALAQALQSGTRGIDLVARFGGEEFCIIVPGADAEATARIAERARLEVATLQQEHQGSPIGFVTVSTGVAATVPTGDHTVDDLLHWADEGLYEAKRNGRNRVSMYRR